MTCFRIDYVDPLTGEWASVEESFVDWKGRAQGPDGLFVGPWITITAKEHAEDLGYTLADKGQHLVTELG